MVLLSYASGMFLMKSCSTIIAFSFAIPTGYSSIIVEKMKFTYLKKVVVMQGR